MAGVALRHGHELGRELGPLGELDLDVGPGAADAVSGTHQRVEHPGDETYDDGDGGERKDEHADSLVEWRSGAVDRRRAESALHGAPWRRPT